MNFQNETNLAAIAAAATTTMTAAVRGTRAEWPGAGEVGPTWRLEAGKRGRKKRRGEKEYGPEEEEEETPGNPAPLARGPFAAGPGKTRSDTTADRVRPPAASALDHTLSQRPASRAVHFYSVRVPKVGAVAARSRTGSITTIYLVVIIVIFIRFFCIINPPGDGEGRRNRERGVPPDVLSRDSAPGSNPCIFFVLASPRPNEQIFDRLKQNRDPSCDKSKAESRSGYSFKKCFRF